MIVAIESIGKRRRRIVKSGGAGVDQENIHPAVVVVIKDCHPCPHSFREISLRGAAALMNPGNPRFGRGHLTIDRSRCPIRQQKKKKKQERQPD
jgi:hypothetical protein